MGTAKHLLTSVAAMAAAMGIASAETKNFDLDGFTKVRGTSAVDVIVEVGPDFSVQAESDDAIDEARAVVDGDVLVLSREGKKGFSMRVGRSGNITYRISMPSLDGAESSAGSEVRVSGIDAADLELSASSGSDLHAEGRCDTLEVSVSSGADVNAYDLSCDDVTARASSGGDIEITAREAVDARASSGGGIDVRGNPDRQRTKESSGGNVSIRS
ncbi:MAG: head GIN domain-containing protein [Parvularcula sp.]|jgi:hypothetical protein|nr:head GIN domain-containing protein [Parvularcula sp.]